MHGLMDIDIITEIPLFLIRHEIQLILFGSHELESVSRIWFRPVPILNWTWILLPLLAYYYYHIAPLLSLSDSEPRLPSSLPDTDTDTDTDTRTVKSQILGAVDSSLPQILSPPPPRSTPPSTEAKHASSSSPPPPPDCGGVERGSSRTEWLLVRKP